MRRTQPDFSDARYGMVEIRFAATARDRMRGMLGLHELSVRGVEFVLHRCGSVHTFGMRYPIDIAFVDRFGLVVAVKRSMPPSRVVIGGYRAYSTIERVSSGEEWLERNDYYPINELVSERRLNETLSRMWLKRV